MNIISWLLALIGLGTSSEAMLNRAAHLIGKGDLTSAVEFYKKAIVLDPYSSKAYEGLGKIYFRMDFRTEAEREFAIADGLDALEINPKNFTAALTMSKALMAKGLHAQARTALNGVFTGNENNPELLKTLGLCHKALNNDQKAREYFFAAMDKNPNDADLNLKIGELELKLGNKSSGQWHLRLSQALNKLDLEPEDVNNYYNTAKLLIVKDKIREAVALLLKSVEIDPKYAEGWMLLGDLYKKSGQSKAAVEALNKVVNMNPDDPKPMKLLAEAYSLAGDFDQSRALREMAEAMQAGKDGTEDPKQAVRHINYLLKQKQYGKVVAKLDEAVSKWPTDITIKLLQGRILLQQKKFHDSVRLLKEVIDVDQQSVTPHIYLAMAYNRMGQAMNALAEGQLSTKLAPKSPQAHKALGDIYRDQKKFSLAASSYEVADRLRGRPGNA